MRLFLIAAAILAVAWFPAELRGTTTVRRALGAALAMALVVSVAYQGAAEHLSTNAYFTTAAKTLLDDSVTHLQQGRTQAVLREWSRASAGFAGTDENRGGFAEVVEQAVAGMRRR